jgi:hypothetical protein
MISAQTHSAFVARENRYPPIGSWPEGMLFRIMLLAFFVQVQGNFGQPAPHGSLRLGSKPCREARRQERSISSKNELKTIAVFKKLGYGVVKPKVDVPTFNKWIDQRLRPKEGEHAAKVANLRLFHRSRCRALTKEEKAEFAEKVKPKAARQPRATVIPINQPSA